MFHIVFSAKDRLRILKPDLTPRLFQYMGGIAHECGTSLLAINGPEDHVHCLAQIPPAISVSTWVKTIKANSSKWVREELPEYRPFGWQAGYGAFSVSYSNVPAVKKYIANQIEHHRKQSFDIEFRALLGRHAVKFEETYFME
ncbi:MAG: IS200/IS605 family transposase [Planctomycetota bacterium]|nr:IS200/IS605 family transposase [Planctomycetota bacterium]